jgi:ABC-2 type transport system ATP-binding protein
MSAELEVEDLSVSYGKFSITKASFTLKSGDIMGLLGRSGSGKTTLLKALLGLEKSKGHVNFTMNSEPENFINHVGYSPQKSALYPFLTVEENLDTFGKLNNLDKDYIKKRSNNLLRAMALQQARTKKITQLSGGMEKRADLAVALLNDPAVIILD